MNTVRVFLHPLRARPCVVALFAVFMFHFAVNGSGFSNDPESPSNANPLQKKIFKVLILSSFNVGYRWTDNMLRGIGDEFARSGLSLDPVVRFMDMKRVPFSEEYFNRIRDMLESGYRDIPFDAIMACDNDALDFLTRYRDELFPAVPVVFASINDFDPKLLNGRRDITGTSENADYTRTIEAGLKILPRTTKIIVVTDGTTTGAAHRSAVEKIRPLFAGRADFEIVSFGDYTLEELGRRLASLKNDCFVLLLHHFRDRLGVAYSIEQSTPYLTSRSAVPCFALADIRVGLGALGGMVVSGYHHGEAAARMVVSILNGTKVQSIPVMLESPNRFMFDYRVMRRFGVKESDLPGNSIVISRDESLLGLYRGQVKMISIVLVMLCLLLIAMAIEIRRRKESEKALKNSQRFNETLLNTSPDIVYVYDIVDKCNVYSNEGLSLVLGYTPSEVKAMGDRLIETLMPPEDFCVYVNETLPKYQTVSGHEFIEHEYRMRHKDGQLRWLSSKESVFLRGEDGRPRQIFGIITDITARVRAEEELREVTAAFQALMENSPIYIFFKDHEIRPIYLSRNFEKMLNMPLDRILGRSMDELFPSDLAQKMVTDDKKILEEGKLIQVDEELDGRQYTTVKFPIKRSGKPPMLAGFTIDITDRKRAEEERVKLIRQLLQSQKMEAIGTLAGGIAHDFNNMLGVIIGNVSLLLCTLDKEDEMREVLHEIQEGAKQAHYLTQQLLTFSKGGEPIRTPANLNDVVMESAQFVTRGANSRCDFKLSENLWTAEVDTGQIHQVVSNIVINANQAMPLGGIISIRTENVRIEAENGLPVNEGRYVRITVEDSGVGISEDHLASIFDPFFTTKQKGSGLGLATAYSIVKRHEGHITVYSEVGKGTVFNVYIPASCKEVEDPEPCSVPPHVGQGRILLMDDQEQILRMMVKILGQMGYQTECATDGAMAVELFKKAHLSENPFDLVILDLTVPGGMGGTKAIIELLKIDANVKAVVSSGYSNDPIMANYRDYGFCGVVPKPYTKDQMASLLNELFGDRGTVGSG